MHRSSPACILLAAAAVAAQSSDLVRSLPTYGPLGTKQYAGFVNGTAAGNNKLHYWFAERESGHDASVPLLLWLNGGPGASSLTGLLAEKLGPQSITADATLVDNPDSITRYYHLLTFDNPVGSGYSTTADGSYVRSEEEMRAQLLCAIRGFFAMHPEYASNPFWVTGESYAGKYVPNIAYEIATVGTEIPLQGIVVGNGVYDMKTQVPTLGAMAFGAGVIDEAVLSQMEERQGLCLGRLDSTPEVAGDFCENVTVRWLYTPAQAGALFYYDLGLEDAHFFDSLTDAMGKYLNDPATRDAVHAGDAVWAQADEAGPVSDALMADWAVSSSWAVEALLEKGYRVRMYNGVRDASVCNHLGNLQVALQLNWTNASGFRAAPTVPWPSRTNVNGHIRTAGLLQYATVLRTGHLVPTVVPKVFTTLLHMLLQ